MRLGSHRNFISLSDLFWDRKQQDNQDGRTVCVNKKLVEQ